MEGYAHIDMPKLSLKVARNFMWLEKLVFTAASPSLIMPTETLELDHEPIQHGVVVGLGPIAYGEGYRRGQHVLYRRGSSSKHTFMGRKLILIFSSEIVSVKLENPAPDHGDTPESCVEDPDGCGPKTSA